MQRRNYEQQKYRLQVELLKLQAWVKETGQKVVILFEGARCGGQGEPSSASWNTSIHGARASSRWKSRARSKRGQWYFQRYVQHLPTNGEIVLFDRSGTTGLASSG